MANPGDFAYSVKQQADIVRIIGEYITLKRSGAQNYSGLCPFHGEKTPSFSVHATRQFYHCFGCGVSGDVFKFVQEFEKITFPEAVRVVAHKMGIPLPKVEFSSPQEAREAKARAVLVKLNESACAFFQEQLRKPEGTHAREYLASRGLNDEAIARFRIGYAPESGFLLRDSLKGMAEEEFLRESGLFSWKEQDTPGRPGAKGQPAPPSPAALYSKFRNRVMFPICNEQGKVIAFTGRTLAADEKSGPKYLNSPETAVYQKSRVLFNLHLAKEAIRQLDYVILVEGQMDCISVFNAGYHNVVASSGTAFTEVQARLLSRFTKKIVINFDPDAAGAKAAERSLDLLVAEDFEIRVVTLEQGFDPDLYIRKKGTAAYADALRGGARYFDYLIQRAQQMFPPRNPDAKVKAINFLLPHIQKVSSRIVRDELAADVAHKLQIDSAVLRQELKNVASNRSAAKVHAPAQSPITEAERLLIRALTGGEQFNFVYEDENGQEQVFSPCEQAHYALSTEKLHVGLATENLFTLLLQASAEGRDPMTLELSESERRILATTLMDEQETISAELLFSAVEALRRHKWEHRRQELKTLIADAERRNDFPLVQQYLQEKIEIDKYLRLGAVAQG